MLGVSQRPETSKAFWYLGVTATIPIMAFAGYVIGRQYHQEILGALAGTLLGTCLVWIDMLRLSGLVSGKKKMWTTWIS
jgi:hypothetical protein